MAEEKKTSTTKVRTVVNNNNAQGAIYGLGVIGAAVYYLQHADTFLMGIIGLFKAVFWPSVLIYKVLELLKM